MKHLLIILSFLLLSSPLFGQSSKYESVNQCVLQTMKENKLTGNDMFKMVKEECERILGKTNNLQKQQRGVLFQRKVNGKWSWHQRGNEEKDLKYVGEIKNGKPEGDGIWTSHNGDSFSGEWKNGNRMVKELSLILMEENM